jgi:hypothetical protein
MNNLKGEPEIFSVIVRGKKNSGKSTTIQEVCRKIYENSKDAKLCRLDIWAEKICDCSIANITNGTYIVSVKEKNILIIAGAPTEQGKTVIELFDCCKKLGIPIAFILSAMRSREVLPKFDTINQIKKISTLLDVIVIDFVEEKEFKKSPEWQARIDKIVKLVTEHIS